MDIQGGPYKADEFENEKKNFRLQKFQKLKPLEKTNNS